MSGHSKWATIKHKKGAADVKRGKLFAKLIRQVEVAAKNGGGDPDMNPNLRTMFQKARDASVPIDTIERAIKRGTGELEGVIYEEVNYEGYAGHGVAVFVETLTDNRNRTGPEMRSTFSKLGGSIAEPGAVAWQFERKGILHVVGTMDEDEIMMAALDAGADDVARDGEFWAVTCEATLTSILRTALEKEGVTVDSSDLTMIPTSMVELDDIAAVRSVLKLIDALEENDDVQDVYANFDIPDALLEQLAQ
ncbi:DNA-binding regulatory protein, YebC/PmpR family [Actinobacteria bacterium IMCC26207]|nr:DNA-binding regulatory protein, YebC/PmpR family [Actinobacteria bacterium IMCC26207]